MKNILTLSLSVILICCFQISGAQISGTLTSANNQHPVEGAAVRIVNTKMFTLSAADGSFGFKNLKPGSYSLRISYQGRDTLITDLTVATGKAAPLHIVLPLNPRHLEEVVVTGQYLPQSIRNSVYAVRVIDSANIAARAATNLQQVLENETGIRFSFDPALGESDIQLNGVSGQNVKVLLDGIPMIERGAARNSINQIDVADIDHIEIVEGPMSVIYGTDALGGVLNIITKKGGDAGGLSVQAHVQEESAGNEYDFFDKSGVHNERIGLKYSKGSWYADASVTRNNFGGWKGDTTGRPNVWLPKDQWLPSARVGYRHRGLSIWNRTTYLDESLYSYGAAVNDAAADQTFITHRLTDLIEANWRISGKVTFNGAGSYQHLQRRTLSTVFTPSTGETHLNPNPGASQDLAKFDNAFFRGTVNWYLSEKVTIQPGTEIQWDQGSGGRINGVPAITDYAGFVTAEIKPTAFINIRPGVRLLHNTVYQTPVAVPSLNTKFRLSQKMDFRASYGYGYRAPSLEELFFSFHDANHNIEGNPDLRAEHSNTFDASLSWHNTGERKWRMVSHLSGLYSLFADKIDLAMKAGSGSLYTYINISSAKATGFRWDGTASTKRLTATAGVSYIGYYNQYSDSKTVSGENKTFAWSPEASANALYLIPVIETNLGVFYKFTGQLPSYQINSSNELYLAKQASFNDLDITLSKKVGKFLTIQTGAKNIFNVTMLNNTAMGSTQAHGGGGGPVLKNYGRSWFLGLTFQSGKLL